VAALVASERTFEALKTLRGLFPVEDAILAGRAITARAA
jgi:flagellar biosynthesis regulator FlbT